MCCGHSCVLTGILMHVLWTFLCFNWNFNARASVWALQHITQSISWTQRHLGIQFHVQYRDHIWFEWCKTAKPFLNPQLGNIGYSGKDVIWPYFMYQYFSKLQNITAVCTTKFNSFTSTEEAQWTDWYCAPKGRLYSLTQSCYVTLHLGDSKFIRNTDYMASYPWSKGKRKFTL